MSSRALAVAEDRTAIGDGAGQARASRPLKRHLFRWCFRSWAIPLQQPLLPPMAKSVGMEAGISTRSSSRSRAFVGPASVDQQNVIVHIVRAGGGVAAAHRGLDAPIEFTGGELAASPLNTMGAQEVGGIPDSSAVSVRLSLPHTRNPGTTTGACSWSTPHHTHARWAKVGAVGAPGRSRAIRLEAAKWGTVQADLQAWEDLHSGWLKQRSIDQNASFPTPEHHTLGGLRWLTKSARAGAACRGFSSLPIGSKTSKRFKRQPSMGRKLFHPHELKQCGACAETSPRKARASVAFCNASLACFSRIPVRSTVFRCRHRRRPGRCLAPSPIFRPPVATLAAGIVTWPGGVAGR